MILADPTTGVIVAGATGRQGLFHIRLMNEYAAQVSPPTTDSSKKL